MTKLSTWQYCVAWEAQTFQATNGIAVRDDRKRKSANGNTGFFLAKAE
jgi:hypothetical protein